MNHKDDKRVLGAFERIQEIEKQLKDIPDGTVQINPEQESELWDDLLTLQMGIGPLRRKMATGDASSGGDIRTANRSPQLRDDRFFEPGFGVFRRHDRTYATNCSMRKRTYKRPSAVQIAVFSKRLSFRSQNNATASSRESPSHRGLKAPNTP